MIYPFLGQYTVTTPYGIYDTAYSRYPGSKHPGVDWGLPAGTLLVASMAGTVKVFRSTAKTGRGNEVWITEGNVSVRACHMDTITVSDGMKVTEGQPIGTSGFTGYVVDRFGKIGTKEGAHLHFEVLIDGQYINPLKVLETKGEDMRIPVGVMDSMKFLATRQKVTKPEIEKYQDNLEGYVQYLTTVQAQHNVAPMVVGSNTDLTPEQAKALAALEDLKVYFK